MYFLKTVHCKNVFRNIVFLQYQEYACSIKSMHFSHTYILHFNHAVRKANAPEMLSDGEYISDVEEGICKFLL